MQSLELVNGKVLARRLECGAKTLLAGPPGREPDIEKVVQALYLRALGRRANGEESALARSLIGSSNETPAMRQQGWEDFLWLIFMNPEFAFIP